MPREIKTITATKSKTGTVSLLVLIASLLLAAWIGYIGTSLVLGS